MLRSCTLKERLISAPILGMQSDSGMFLRDSDASSIGLGAVKFTIRTDLSALQWLRKTPEPMARMARWLAYIEQFDSGIQQRAGSKHGLSRTPTNEDAARMVRQQDDYSSLDDVINDRQALTKAQLDDPDIGPVLRAILRSPKAPDIGHWTANVRSTRCETLCCRMVSVKAG